MIKNIIFDVGMVLVDFRYMEFSAELGFSPDEVKAVCGAMINTPEWEMLDKGIITQSQAKDRFIARDPELKPLIERFWKDLTEIVRPFPRSKEWLRSLKERGYNIYLLTNYPEEMFALHSKTQFDFLDYVDGMVVSSYVKLTKPDRRIYECLMKKYSLKSGECVFLDDRPDNIKAAELLGIRAILVTGQSKAIDDLGRLLAELNTEE